MKGLLQLTQADLSFGTVRALQGITLGVEAGERVALIGSNGSGKSSLLRLLHGLLPPTQGHWQRDPKALRRLGF